MTRPCASAYPMEAAMTEIRVKSIFELLPRLVNKDECTYTLDKSCKRSVGKRTVRGRKIRKHSCRIILVPRFNWSIESSRRLFGKVTCFVVEHTRGEKTELELVSTGHTIDPKTH